MTALALKLIEENKAAHARGEKSAEILDLRNCGLTELPDQLFDLEWIKGVFLGGGVLDHEKKEWVRSKNKGPSNRILNVQEGIARLEGLHLLDLSSNKIRDFRFLENLTGLQSLDLSYNQISDIRFLENLTGLQELDLSSNKISDIRFLENLTGLQSLELRGNQISDIRFLEYLTGLQELDLSSNKISDFRFLQNLTGLQSLDLSYNQISDIRFLQNLTGLQSLDLSYNQISDIRFLENLTGLQELDLSSNQIRDFRFLENLTGLQSLELRGNQISDIRFLEYLTGLQELDLSSNQIRDFRFLQNLTGLQSLYLMNNQISDIRFLQNLTGLQELDLSSNQIRDIRFLEYLTGLQSLYLMNNQISDIRFLEYLTGLQSLELSSNQISDIRFLEYLTGLQSLHLSSNQISDIRFLEYLTGLQSLHLSYNQISDIRFLEYLTGLQSLELSSNQISDIRFLEYLTGLQSLDLSSNQVSDFRFLENLTGLQSLRLWNNQISDIRFLEYLTGLQSLDLSYNQISDIRFLQNLTGLQSLHLSENRVTEFPKFLLGMPRLTKLNLYGNPIGDVPYEIINTGYLFFSNCLKGARDYFSALEKGSVPNVEAKLILLGNGRVGKTSLVRAMLDRAFCENVESTDQISLRPWQLENGKTGKLKAPPLQVNIWDFGGQEIYYATHRIFLRTRALFLLVWDRQTEETPSHKDNHENTFENFRLPHWIDYIRTASDGSPVIVVQNKVDSRDDKDTSHEKLLREHYEPIFDFQYVSARNDHAEGMPSLRDCIYEAYKTKVPAIGQLIGKQWMAVKERLKAIQDKRWIEYAAYLEICGEEGLEGSEHETLINLLHDSGFLYNLKNRDAPKLILDQRWAIDAVYAVLNRSKGCYKELCLKNRHGFTLSDLGRLVWDENYSPEEQKELLKFMVDAKVCLEFAEGVYIAPQLLDSERPPRVGRRKEWKEPQGPAVKFSYRFLHSAIIEGFVVRAGRMVRDEDPLIWRNGIAIYDEDCETDALVEADANKKEIRVLTHGERPILLLRKIIKELSRLHRDYEPEKLFSTDGGARFVSEENLQNYYKAKAETVMDEDGEFIELAGFRPFLEMLRKEDSHDRKKEGLPETMLKKTRMEPEKPVLKCFISYAHFYAEASKAFVEDFETAAANKPFQLSVCTDERIEVGEDWHESIQKEIAQCDLAILLVSDRFMTSEYIKHEEVEKLFDRKSTGGVKVLPVYFAPCDFSGWSLLSKNQLYKPKGADYGCADKDPRDWFSYCDLVDFEYKDGVKIPRENINRSRYMKDFIDKITTVCLNAIESKT